MSVARVEAHVSPSFVEMQFANRVQVAIRVHEAGCAWTRTRRGAR